MFVFFILLTVEVEEGAPNVTEVHDDNFIVQQDLTQTCADNYKNLMNLVMGLMFLLVAKFALM